LIRVAAPEASRSATSLETTANAWDGTSAFNPTPSNAMTAVNRMPPYGTPLRLILAAKAGAERFTAMERKILPVEYKPALRLESAAVRTTKFMMEAAVIPAWGLPKCEKNVTNGDSPAL
jgi:hypothetical protein